MANEEKIDKIPETSTVKQEKHSDKELNKMRDIIRLLKEELRKLDKRLKELE